MRAIDGLGLEGSILEAQHASLLEAFGLSCPLRQLHQSSLCRPMGFRAFTEAFRGVLVQLGEGPDAETFTFNSLRRFMATLANFLHLDPQQAQAIGHWQKIPHGAQVSSGGALSSMRARFPMAETVLWC